MTHEPSKDPSNTSGRSAPPVAAQESVGPPPSFLQWLPWEKLLIWGLFLLAVYALRHFFLIIFLTFIVSYIMRGVVLQVVALISADKERVWVERALTVVCFILFLFGLYQVGRYLGPRLQEQGAQLVDRVRYMNPEVDFHALRWKVIGPFLFTNKFGSRDSEDYQKAFQETLKVGLPQSARFADFGDAADDLERRFQTKKRGDLLAQYQSQAKSGEGQNDFESWLRVNVAPRLYSEQPDRYRSEWESEYRQDARQYDLVPLEELEDSQRLDLIHSHIVVQLIHMTPESWQHDYRAQWQDALGSLLLARFSGAPEYEEQFRSFYETVVQESSTGLPADYETFRELEVAHSHGQEAFTDVLERLQPSEKSEADRLEEAHENFRVTESQKLTDEFMRQPFVRNLSENVNDYLDSWVSSLAGWVRDALHYLLTLPVQIALSLLLSLFITFDIPKIKQGIRRLEDSRVRDFYREIAPGLINFGALIGRAFQAQGVIAIFNTLLTFTAIKLLGIDNEVFLCAIVFVCSFIPVLGVVMSSVPIAIMALLQPGGNIWLALYIIGAILIIHFIETSVLNPKILGDMLHLHPVLVLAVLAIGEHFFGMWGLLLAVPVTVYIIRCVLLDEGVPGLIDSAKRTGGSRRGKKPLPASDAPASETPTQAESVGRQTVGVSDSSTEGEDA